MECNLIFPCNLADRVHVSDCSDFIVYMHERNEDGVFPQRIFDKIRGDQSVLVGGEISDFVPVSSKMATSIENRPVLKG